MAASTNLTPAERRLRAQIAANARWANTDRAEASRRARETLIARFERQVDPDGTLRPDERARRADNAMRADMQRKALAAAKARRDKRGAA